MRLHSQAAVSPAGCSARQLPAAAAQWPPGSSRIHPGARARQRCSKKQPAGSRAVSGVFMQFQVLGVHVQRHMSRIAASTMQCASVAQHRQQGCDGEAYTSSGTCAAALQQGTGGRQQSCQRQRMQFQVLGIHVKQHMSRSAAAGDSQQAAAHLAAIHAVPVLD